MSETQGFEALQAIATPAPDAAPPAEPKRDQWGRSYATGKRKNAVARVWIKPGKGKITINGRFPERVLEKAVERMLPKESPLARKQLTHLKIYNGGEHPHAAQNPETIAFAELNAKNVRSA